MPQQQATTPPDELHTYDDWRRLGFQVQRGERHIARGLDQFGGTSYLFGPAQVRPSENRVERFISQHVQAYQQRIRQISARSAEALIDRDVRATPHRGVPPVTEQRPRVRLEMQEGPWERFLKIEKQMKGK